MKGGSQDVQGILRTVWTLVGNTGPPSSETLCGKDHDGFRGFFEMINVSRQSEVTLHTFVTSKRPISGC